MSGSAKRKESPNASQNQSSQSGKKRKLSSEVSHGNDMGSISKNSLHRGDALKWKEVPRPVHLDDAEGFFGLEEIEGVEVVKDLENGRVMFQPKNVSDIVVYSGDEWAGFGDDANGDTVAATQGEEPLKGILKVKQTKKAQQKEKPTKTRKNGATSKKSDQDGTVPASMHFDLLNGVDEEQVPQVDVEAWKELDLSDAMLSAISRVGFANPTPIQQSAIPAVLEGQDVIGKAVTGSGKTLAFGIPILEKWLAAYRPISKAASPTALILAPTRELAHQLNKHLTDLGKGLDPQPRIATVTGGLSILKQQRQLENVDIIIGTPGRLWEIINETEGLLERLKQIKFLVVDEADRLLSEGHFKEVEEILAALDRQIVDEGNENSETTSSSTRQTLVFSATFHKGLQQKLTGKLKPGSNIDTNNLLSNEQSMVYLLQKLSFRSSKPVFIDSNPTSQMASSLKESIVECGAMEKDLYLYTLLLQNPYQRTLVFTNSISAVKRLTQIMQNLNQPAHALHSGMLQKARLRSLERFDSAKSSILIATDVAARGLDIKNIDLIIHYHVPRTADMYVHRSGRTARASTSGRSILLCSPDEVVGVTRLISKIHSSSSGKAPETISLDRNLITRLHPRIQLSQKITESSLAKDKGNSSDNWLKTAAEELGVDYDSEEFEAAGQRGKRGRGGGKAQKQKEKGAVSKEAIGEWRARLKEMLAQKVNLGFSERYLAGGRVDVEALLAGKQGGMFLEG